MNPPDGPPLISGLQRELRVLVLHNQDFASPSGFPPAAPSDGHLDDVSRADVANAAHDVARALAARGHFAEILGIDRPDLSLVMERLQTDPPDLVFNLVESLLSDDRHNVLLPALLDLYEVPYTGPGPLALRLTLHKYPTSLLLRGAGIPTPACALLPGSSLGRSRADDLAAIESLAYPLFLKLAETDGSIGISESSIIHTDEQFIRQLDFLRHRYHQPILAESYIAGREIYVSVLGNLPPRLFPLQEMDFSTLPEHIPPIISERSKWDASSTEYRRLSSVRALPISSAVQLRIEEVARKSFEILDLADYGRIDLRVTEDGTPHVIDLNPNCDLSEGAGFSRAGLLAGLPYDQLIEQIAFSTLQRTAHAKSLRSRTAPHPLRPAE